MHKPRHRNLIDQLRKPGSLWFEASDDSPSYGESFLFTDPVEVLPLCQGGDIRAWFALLESWLARGFSLAGWLGYEAGYELDPALDRCRWPDVEGGLLGWFGVYRQDYSPAVEEIAAFDADASAGMRAVSGLQFDLSEQDYIRHIESIREEIAAGNVYQVNFTGRCRFSFEGDPQALYAAVKRRQPSSWSAYLNTGDRIVLSFSPELFFAADGGHIETMPMKGTAPRGIDPGSDRQELERLAACEKNRAENLMIVDLLRNDLGRVCATGSVKADSLFETRTYPTLHQMVSTVTGRLPENTALFDLFRALFPSGSVTGAPKIRAMELARSLEREPRGIYTGSVGFILPGGKMAFNVAIRTVELRGRSGIYGIGSGIVWDSDPTGEYRECLLKARILSEMPPAVTGIFETILWNGDYLLQSDHLDRMTVSALALGISFDRDAALRELGLLEERLHAAGGLYRIRLQLDRGRGVTVSAEPFRPGPPGLPVRVCLAAVRVRSDDLHLRHKSIHRERYDQALADAQRRGYHEALFMNERGEVTEGSISNVLACIGGVWCTPPLSSGLLDGVYRRYLLRTRLWVRERTITLDELRNADQVMLCNALRGLRPADREDVRQLVDAEL